MGRHSVHLGLVLMCLLVMGGCTRGLVAPQYGLQEGQLGICTGLRGCVSSQSGNPEHFIEPLTYEGARYEARYDLLVVLRSFPNSKAASSFRNYLRFEFPSMEGVSLTEDSDVSVSTVDVTEFYFDADKMLIHVRSLPRRNMPDSGENRNRVEMIRRSFIEQQRSRR